MGKLKKTGHVVGVRYENNISVLPDIGPHHFLNKTPTLNQRISMAGYAVTEKGAERNVTYLCVFGDLQSG